MEWLNGGRSGSLCGTSILTICGHRSDRPQSTQKHKIKKSIGRENLLINLKVISFSGKPRRESIGLSEAVLLQCHVVESRPYSCSCFPVLADNFSCVRSDSLLIIPTEGVTAECRMRNGQEGRSERVVEQKPQFFSLLPPVQSWNALMTVPPCWLWVFKGSDYRGA